MVKLGPVLCDSSPNRYKKDWSDEGKSELLGFYVSYSDTELIDLQFLYNDKGKTVMSDSYLATTGPSFKQVMFKYPSEYLTGVSGSYQSFVSYNHEGWGFKSLTFVTNKATYGPFGATHLQDTAKSFSFDWGPNNIFRGFYGEHNYYRKLAALGFYIAIPKCETDEISEAFKKL